MHINSSLDGTTHLDCESAETINTTVTNLSDYFNSYCSFCTTNWASYQILLAEKKMLQWNQYREYGDSYVSHLIQGWYEMINGALTNLASHKN